VRFRDRGLARGGDVVEATPWTLFRGSYFRVFEAAEQEASLFEPIECAIEGAVGGEPPRLFALFEFAGYGIAVELGRTAEGQRNPGGQDGDFEGHERARFATHGGRIRR
jgi:hypothetical protein